jgi:hypothetical protein
LLLERDIDVNHKDVAGMTAVSYARDGCRTVSFDVYYERTLVLLLGRGAIDIT